MNNVFGRIRTSLGPAPTGPKQPEPDDDPELESRLMWMWGSPRSGSTWLLRLLAHPLEPDPDTLIGFKPPDGSGTYDALPIDESFISNHLAPALADPRIVDGRWVPGTINNLLGGRPAYAYSDAYRYAWEPAARRFALTRVQAVIDRARAADVAFAPGFRVVIKETNGSHAADIVMRTMPQARLLLLIRDGRDVVDSLMDAYQPGGFFANKQGYAFETTDQRSEGLLWAARLWACNTDMTLRAMEEHDPALCRTVRYEDLLSDGAAELAGVYEWLGLERTPEQVAATVEALSFSKLPKQQTGPKTRNRAASPGLWRENLSASEQRAVNDICGPLLGRFGYEL